MVTSLYKSFLLFVLSSTVSAGLGVMDDSEIRRLLVQERQRLVSSKSSSSCHEEQCSPGHCIEVLGRATCLCPEGYRSNDGKCVVKKCSVPILCWPEKCIVKNSRETCLSPEGFVSTYGMRKRIRNRCQRSLDCAPGQCMVVDERDVCLCPPGYFSEQGFCKEINNSCSNLNCKPGKCIEEFDTQKCLCPTGFTAQADKCIEISIKIPGKLSTVMLMVVVASASVILTTLFGVAICYYLSQRN